jgi:hypothetical protein
MNHVISRCHVCACGYKHGLYRSKANGMQHMDVLHQSGVPSCVPRDRGVQCGSKGIHVLLLVFRHALAVQVCVAFLKGRQLPEPQAVPQCVWYVVSA